jgi:hypothetical protein
MPTYRGGCHCGRTKFEVTPSRGRELTRVSECNCSICASSGFLHWRIEPDELRMITPWKNLSTYIWGTGRARHYFCPTCGVAPLRNPRSDPTKISVNARCIDGIDLAKLTLEHFDGRNWEAAQSKLKDWKS